MQNANEKFLPIGSVVMLKGATKRLMITGFCASQPNEKMWDYSGCLYPEGILDYRQTALFNHDQIETIFFYGLRDEEEQKYKQNLNEYIRLMETKNHTQNGEKLSTKDNGSEEVPKESSSEEKN